MGFNDDIFQLAGGNEFKSSNSDKEEKKTEEQKEQKKQEFVKSEIGSGNTKWSSEYGNPDQDYVIESDLIVPSISAKKDPSINPLIVVVDDDFETLDLMEIYLCRNYTYKSFSGPREAIFFLNQNTPEVIFLDCKIHTMKAMTFIDIVRMGKGNENVPFVLLGEEEELNAFDPDLLPKAVIGKLKKPVARGILQGYIDRIVNADKE